MTNIFKFPHLEKKILPSFFYIYAARFWVILSFLLSQSVLNTFPSMTVTDQFVIDVFTIVVIDIYMIN